MVGWTGCAVPLALVPPGDTREDVPLLVTLGGCGTPGDTREDVVPRIYSHVHPAEHLLQELLSTGAPGGTWEPDKENNLSNLLISMTLKQTTGSKVLEEQGQR